MGILCKVGSERHREEQHWQWGVTDVGCAEEI
jgi:hypothetical protein